MGHEAEDLIGKRCYQVFAGVSDRGVLTCAAICKSIRWARRERTAESHVVRTRTRDSGVSKRISITHVLLPADTPKLRVLVHIFHVEAERLSGLLSGTVRAPASAANGSRGELSPRELEILRLLAQGLGTQSIADMLVITTTTVRNHVQRILGKQGVHTRLEAVAAAARQDLLSELSPSLPMQARSARSLTLRFGHAQRRHRERAHSCRCHGLFHHP